MRFFSLRPLTLIWKSLFTDSPELAWQRYVLHRARLQADFFARAAAAGKPRGLRWVHCDWLPETQLLRDRQSGLLTLLVSINVRFEAIPGGDMEDVEAVGTIRDASAVFHYQQGRWGTGGRALFNLHPAAAARRLSDTCEPVSLSAAGSR